MVREPGARGESKGREAFSIGALSRAARIPVETIRTWEQRYGSPVSTRKPSGHRLYAASAIEQLRRVGRLLSHGHRPGEILPLSLPELDRLLSLSESGSAPSSASADSAAVDDGRITGALERLLRATTDLDRGAMVRELQSSWAGLGPLRFLERVAGAWMTAVGAAWRDGDLEVRHEHFASACLADFLCGVREPFDLQARGPRVVAALLPGERHEGGLLMTSVLLAVRGHRVLYLGRDTPVDQIAAAVRDGGAEAVAVSVSAGTNRADAARELARLRDALPHRLSVWAGGAGVPPSVERIMWFESLSAFDEHLLRSSGEFRP